MLTISQEKYNKPPEIVTLLTVYIKQNHPCKIMSNQDMEVNNMDLSLYNIIFLIRNQTISGWVSLSINKQ